MSGTSNWKTIREKRVGNDPARVARAREKLLSELRLANLRRHRSVSQAEVAEALAVSQANVSQLEHGDIKYSSLASYVSALGGQLVMQAVFDDETVGFVGPSRDQIDLSVGTGKVVDLAAIVPGPLGPGAPQYEFGAKAKPLSREPAGQARGR
jgi:predicted XRE-type DNA-binding protein